MDLQNKDVEDSSHIAMDTGINGEILNDVSEVKNGMLTVEDEDKKRRDRLAKTGSSILSSFYYIV